MYWSKALLITKKLHYWTSIGHREVINGFFKNSFDLISGESSGVLICGRDMKTQLCPNMDSSNKIKRTDSEAVYVKKWLRELGMINIWRDPTQCI